MSLSRRVRLNLAAAIIALSAVASIPKPQRNRSMICLTLIKL
jgi:hypothetical protein